jgi:hypothetical protein
MLILGHDALMAMETVGTPHAVAAAATAHGASDHHAADAEFLAVHDSEPEPTPPQHCGIGLQALPRSSDDVDTFDQALPPVNPFVLSAAFSHNPGASSGWEEPDWPGCRRRALFQVYRI